MRHWRTRPNRALSERPKLPWPSALSSLSCFSRGSSLGHPVRQLVTIAEKLRRRSANSKGTPLAPGRNGTWGLLAEQHGDSDLTMGLAPARAAAGRSRSFIEAWTPIAAFTTRYARVAVMLDHLPASTLGNLAQRLHLIVGLLVGGDANVDRCPLCRFAPRSVEREPTISTSLHR